MQSLLHQQLLSSLCHGPALWYPPSGSDGDSPMHAPLPLTSPSSPSHRYPSVPSVSSPVSVWPPRCRPCHSCRGYDIPHWTAYQMGYVSLTLVNIARRIRPDLKTTLMLNFLQTCQMSSLIPATLGITTSGALSSCSSSWLLVSAVSCVGGAEALRIRFAG